MCGQGGQRDTASEQHRIEPGAVIGAVYGARQASLVHSVDCGTCSWDSSPFRKGREALRTLRAISIILWRLHGVCGISVRVRIVEDGQEVYAPSCPPSIEFAGSPYAYPTGAFSLKDVSFTAWAL